MLKKAIGILAIIMLCGCTQTAPMENTAEVTSAPERMQTRTLWYEENSYENPLTVLNDAEDMDGDGVKENIMLSVNGEDENGYIIASLTVGDSAIKSICEDSWAYGINAVYLSDLTSGDGAKEIAVFFECDSGDPMMKVFRYSGGVLSTLNFRKWSHYESEYMTNDYLWTGNTMNFKFDVHDDGSFTLQTRTDSLGMWHVYVSYKVNEQGIIERVPQSTYEVVQDSWASHEMQDGYFYVKQPCTNHGLVLYAGEWIKAVADDMNGNVLIRKKSGEEGWFEVGTSFTESLDAVSPLFMLAG